MPKRYVYLCIIFTLGPITSVFKYSCEYLTKTRTESKALEIWFLKSAMIFNKENKANNLEIGRDVTLYWRCVLYTWRKSEKTISSLNMENMTQGSDADTTSQF